jgi:hypothetical protein
MDTFQWILAVATILGGISAVWYFRNEILTWRKSRTPAPPAQMPLAQNPTRARVLDAVLRSDPASDWIRANSNARSVASYRNDANLRFVMKHSDDGVQCDDFQEPWANRHPDRRATGYWCDLFYAATLLERFILVGVDGGRALIPVPKDGAEGLRPNEIRPLDYQVGRIFDTSRTLDEYICRSGLRRIEMPTNNLSDRTREK